MSYYLLLYHDGIVSKNNKITEDISKWDNWTREIGNSIVDGGSPLVKAKSVTQDSARIAKRKEKTNYLIIEADNLDEAVELSRGAPALHEGGRADIYRILDPVT